MSFPCENFPDVSLVQSNLSPHEHPKPCHRPLIRRRYIHPFTQGLDGMESLSPALGSSKLEETTVPHMLECTTLCCTDLCFNDEGQGLGSTVREMAALCAVCRHLHSHCTSCSVSETYWQFQASTEPPPHSPIGTSPGCLVGVFVELRGILGHLDLGGMPGKKH